MSTFRAAVRDVKIAAQLGKENERQSLSGVLRQKVTPVVLRHGIDQLYRTGISSAIIGLGLLVIGAAFAVLCIHLITPLSVLYPVTFLLTAVFSINAVNCKAVVSSLYTSMHINTFTILLEKKRKELQEANETLTRKRYKISSSEVLLMLFDSGFCDNIYASLGIMDASVLPLLSTNLVNESNQLHKQLLKDYKTIADSLKQVCNAIERENKSPSDCKFSSRLNRVQKKLHMDVSWDIVSLLLNCVGCFGFFLFPILSFFPSSSSDFNSNAMFFGNLVGNVAWMIEPVLFAVYKHFDGGGVDVQQCDGSEKKNK
jgi:hypothetical protein